MKNPLINITAPKTSTLMNINKKDLPNQVFLLAYSTNV